MKKIKFEYIIEEEKIADFISAINPYIMNVTISNSRYDSSYKRSKKKKINMEIHQNHILEILNLKTELSTQKLYRFVRIRSYPYSLRTFTRFLVDLGVTGFLGVEKRDKTNGGFENVWYLK